ncbi:hypothetical protein PhCBS80983_g04569 [Powellomyces hirtus]|uniref:Uncharacterized protein n=1 Tax=Powellomyces hirtus TaxID=109895 RepID=A0A507DXU8_9FUNG|nr:hypothetical protein PhCBS80983_g04569 [Powellomyces hirtus]
MSALPEAFPYWNFCYNTVWLLLPKAAHLQCAGELLRHAVYWGEHQALTRLLEGGVDANFGCAAALRYAILKRDTKSIDILVQFGVDVNVSNGALLREAILYLKRGCYDMVVYLVQKGALCTYRVLETAAKDEGLFRMLLSYMVDPNYNEVLCAAAAGPHKDLITEIVQREGVNVKYRESMPLRQAARKGTAETVQLLIDLGCDIHSRNNEALAWAALGGNVDTMRLLLDHGADASAMNGRALRKAVSHHMWKDPEVVKLLIQSQKTTAPPHTQIAGIDEALITAAQCGDLNVIRVLLDDGAADPEASDNRALRVAAAFGERALVSLLLDRATYIHTQPERVALLRQLVEESDGPSREGVEHAAFAGWVELETFLRETPYVDPFNREP